jgi:site-specific recombinase XerD
MTAILSLAPVLERFFTQRLIQQRQVSPHTINSYRDTFRQFLKFTRQRLHKSAGAQGMRIEIGGRARSQLRARRRRRTTPTRAARARRECFCPR